MLWILLSLEYALSRQRNLPEQNYDYDLGYLCEMHAMPEAQADSMLQRSLQFSSFSIRQGNVNDNVRACTWFLSSNQQAVNCEITSRIATAANKLIARQIPIIRAIAKNWKLHLSEITRITIASSIVFGARWLIKYVKASLSFKYLFTLVHVVCDTCAFLSLCYRVHKHIPLLLLAAATESIKYVCICRVDQRLNKITASDGGKQWNNVTVRINSAAATA